MNDLVPSPSSLTIVVGIYPSLAATQSLYGTHWDQPCELALFILCLASFPSMSNMDLLHQDMCSWNFNAHRYDTDDLLVMAFIPFMKLHLIDRFNLPSGAELYALVGKIILFPLEVLKKFILKVHLYYKPNPYHNFRHAVDVLQAVYFFLISTQLTSLLTPLDILALIVAALSHDIGHPGCSNFFLVSRLFIP